MPRRRYEFVRPQAPLWPAKQTVSSAQVEAGFSDKAFGMTRTLVDIYVTLRYIANKDTEERASLFYWFELLVRI